MRAVISRIWLDYNEPFEGHLTFMYLDQRRNEQGDLDPLVTSGVGNAFTTRRAVLEVAWFHPDGRRATEAEVLACYDLVLDSFPRGLMNPLDGGVQYKDLPGNTLRTTKAEVSRLAHLRLRQMEDVLREFYFPRFDSWCADLQLVPLSMSWAMGPHGFDDFPKFRRAANADVQDFATMIAERIVNPNVGTIRLRNASTGLALASAQRVVAKGLDPEILHYKLPPEPEEARVFYANIAGAIRKAIDHDSEPDDEPPSAA